MNIKDAREFINEYEILEKSIYQIGKIRKINEDLKNKATNLSISINDDGNILFAYKVYNIFHENGKVVILNFDMPKNSILKSEFRDILGKYSDAYASFIRGIEKITKSNIQFISNSINELDNINNFILALWRASGEFPLKDKLDIDTFDLKHDLIKMILNYESVLLNRKKEMEIQMED